MSGVAGFLVFYHVGKRFKLSSFALRIGSIASGLFAGLNAAQLTMGSILHAADPDRKFQNRVAELMRSRNRKVFHEMEEKRQKNQEERTGNTPEENIDDTHKKDTQSDARRVAKKRFNKYGDEIEE